MEPEEIQKLISEDYFYHHGQLDDKIKNIEKNEKLAVQRACMRLKWLHTSRLGDLGFKEMASQVKLRDSCSSIVNSDDSESCTTVKEEEFSSLQSQVNDLKGWSKTLATALRESSKISQSIALPTKVEAIYAIRKKY